MASTRNLWPESFPQDDIPALPCPWCDRGNLRYIQNTLQLRRPTGDGIAEQNGDIGFLDATWRFSLFLQCAVEKCGNIVSVHGDAHITKRSSYQAPNDEFVHVLHPHGMHPAPPLMTIPPETPPEIASDLQTAFELYWIDLGACANRLRISVEHILDEFGVPGNNLSKRIAAFKEADPEHAGTFDALRFVGNVGSHDGMVEREAILDAFEIYQDAAAELFGKRRARIDLLKKKIIDSKGRYA